MTKADRVGILIAVSLIVLSAISMYNFADMHEKVHVEVYRQNGYINSTYTLDFFGGLTEPGERGPYADYESARDYNVLAEIVGYHMGALITSIWLVALFLVFSLFLIMWWVKE